eukprot:EG_transcript_33028
MDEGPWPTCQVGMVLVRPAATYTYSHGVVYVGGFQNDQFHGPGTMVFPNGDKCEGVWVKGKQNGKGRLTRASGEVFDVLYRDGLFISATAIPERSKAEPD